MVKLSGKEWVVASALELASALPAKPALHVAEAKRAVIAPRIGVCLAALLLVLQPHPLEIEQDLDGEHRSQVQAVAVAAAAADHRCQDDFEPVEVQSLAVVAAAAAPGLLLLLSVEP